MSSEILLFTLLFLLFSGCIIYPPTEFVSSGVTLSTIFAPFLGSEMEHFVLYHIKQSILTLFVYSCLPLFYFLGLRFFHFSDEIAALTEYDRFYLWYVFTTTCFVLPILAVYQIKCWSEDDWKNHPIVINISKFCNNNSNWSSVATDIDAEFRSIDKVCIQTNPICTVVATENWIMKVTPFTIFISHQSDANLQVNQSDTHNMSYNTFGQVQYINIEVKSSRENVEPFNIRLNAMDFQDLQDRIARTIVILPNVSFHKSLMDKFIDAFKESITDNPPYTTNQELENCIGCMQITANVKLQKLCSGDNEDSQCAACYCRPMWCIDCMARWFASRQDAEQPELWLSSKCTCPMCRAKFCISDVCLVRTN